MAKKINNLCHQ